MHQTLKVEGFVLKKKTLLERDIFVTLFTKELGKMAVMAKGVRTFTSRRSAHVQTGNLIKASISHTNDRYFLQSTDLVSGFMNIRTPQLTDYMYTLLAVIDRLLPEGDPEVQIYEIMKRYTVRLSQGENPAEVLRTSLRKILVILGYADQEESLVELIEIAEENMGMKLPRRDIM